jgi:ABC-2 type transport system permease protein
MTTGTASVAATGTHRRDRGRTDPLTGTGKLIRLIGRRDRILLPIWIVLFGLLPLLYASATDSLYPTAESLREYYQSIVTNPSLQSTLGPVFAPNLGALTAWRAGILILFIGLASALTVIRHTRTEEDAGRRELIGATVVGRHAPLAAALAVTFLADLVLGAIMTLGLIGYGLPATGSVAIGMSYALAGWMFGAIGGVAAQLTEGAGAARGLALGALGAAYLLRAAGDAGGTDGSMSWLSWLSPIGWVQRVRPYAGEQWWVFALIVGLVIAGVWLAAALQARRDVGAGIFAARLGPAEASPRLSTPLALAWRLQRGLLVGWVCGFAVIGLVTGGASRSVDSLVEDSPQLRDLLEKLAGTGSLQDLYIASTLGMMALAAGAYAIQATLRLRAEETGQRAEPILATAAGRTPWMASHLFFGALGPALGLIALGLTTALAAGGDADGLGHQIGRVLAGAVLQLPAVWVLAGIAAVLFGLLPRLAVPLAWTALGICIFVTFLGPLLELNQGLLDISPFTHIPKLPGGEFVAAPIGWLLVLVVGLTVAGVAGFRRRDVVSGA